MPNIRCSNVINPAVTDMLSKNQNMLFGYQHKSLHGAP
jgi:hypothetical protein